MGVGPSPAFSPANLFGLSIGVGLPLLPALVEAKERRGRVNPLDETGSGTQGSYNIVPCTIHLLLAPTEGSGRGEVSEWLSGTQSSLTRHIFSNHVVYSLVCPDKHVVYSLV